MQPVIFQDVLVDGLRTNQHWAFNQLYEDYASNLLKYLARIVKNQVEAEDLLQETLIKVWHNIANYDSKQSRLSTWIRRIAYNNALDHIRGRKMLSSLDLDFQFNLPAYTPTYDYISVQEIVNDNLSSKQRQVVDLVYIQGYTMQEVADLLELPLGTVKTRARLALQRLRPHFK